MPMAESLKGTSAAASKLFLMKGTSVVPASKFSEDDVSSSVEIPDDVPVSSYSLSSPDDEYDPS